MAGLSAAQCRVARHAFVQVELSFGLVADKVVGNADQSLGSCDSRRIADRPRDPLGFEGNRQQMPILAGPAIEHVQPRQQPELVGVVAERLCDLKTTPERALGLLAVALREHECVPERGLEFELPCAAAGRVVEHRQARGSTRAAPRSAG